MPPAACCSQGHSAPVFCSTCRLCQQGCRTALAGIQSNMQLAATCNTCSNPPLSQLLDSPALLALSTPCVAWCCIWTAVTDPGRMQSCVLLFGFTTPKFNSLRWCGVHDSLVVWCAKWADVLWVQVSGEELAHIYCTAGRPATHWVTHIHTHTHTHTPSLCDLALQ